jgi:hypothetical protein
MIEGVRQSGASKAVFRHNDLDHLEGRLCARRAGWLSVVLEGRLAGRRRLPIHAIATWRAKDP